MRIRRRHAAVLVVAAIGALAAAGAAFAITNNTSTLSAKLSPNTGLSKTTYKNVSLFVHLHTNFAKPGDKATRRLREGREAVLRQRRQDQPRRSAGL